MTESFELLRDERVLDSRGAIHSFNWILAAEGILHLTNKRLVFVPTGRLDRTVGIHEVVISLRNVLDLGFEGAREPKLVVKTEDKKFVFRLNEIVEPFADAARVAIEELRRKRIDPHATPTPRPGAARGGPATPKTGPRTGPVDLVTHGRSVLILGNTEFYDVMLSDLIKELKAPVLLCSSATEALEHVEGERGEFALLIVNLIDPRLGGSELLERLADPSVFVGAPVWVIEPLFEKRGDAELQAMGVSGFLDKSILPGELSDLVNRLLRGNETPPHRRHPRVSVHFPVEYRVDDLVHTAYARTIGLGGCFLETSEPSPLGAELRVRFQLPALEVMLELEARVVYVRPRREDNQQARGPGMGLKFKDVGDIARDTLRTYIEEHLKYKVNEATVPFGL